MFCHSHRFTQTHVYRGQTQIAQNFLITPPAPYPLPLAPHPQRPNTFTLQWMQWRLTNFMNYGTLKHFRYRPSGINISGVYSFTAGVW